MTEYLVKYCVVSSQNVFLEKWCFVNQTSFHLSLPLSPQAPFAAAPLSGDVLPVHCWTPAKASLAPQPWPGGPHHPRSPSSLRLTISPAEGDAPA